MRFFLLTLDVLYDELVYDYYPKGLEFYHELNHPWLYTQAELDAFNAMRHKETQEWKKR